MGTTMDQVRGLILQEAERRRAEGLWHDNGRPNASEIAKRLGVSHQVLWRILRGIHEQRPAKKRRVSEPRPSADVIRGLMDWLGFMEEADLWSAIRRAPALPPLSSTRTG